MLGSPLNTITLAPENVDSLIEEISQLLRTDPRRVVSNFNIVYTDDNEREVMIMNDNSYKAALMLCNSSKLAINIVPIE